MSSGEYDNRIAAHWARQTFRQRVPIRLLFGSRLGRIFVYALLYSVPACFVAVGLLMFALDRQHRPSSLLGPLVFAFLTSLPCTLIAVLGAYVRRGFAKSLDAEGVTRSFGTKLRWNKLYYVDHVSKHGRAGGVSREVRDNQIELVFEGGKAVVPPMIRDRAAVWALLGSVPAEVRDDGVRRTYPPPGP